MLSGFWGDIWAISDTLKIIVYYDADGLVEHVVLDKDTHIKELQATVIIEDVIYLVSGEGIPMEVDESAYLGYANPYMESISEEDKNRYFDPNLEMPYAEVEGDIVVLYQDEWHKCTIKEATKDD